MNDARQRALVLRLLSRRADGSLSDEEHTQLAQMLEESAELRQVMLRHVLMEGLLFREVQGRSFAAEESHTSEAAENAAPAILGQERLAVPRLGEVALAALAARLAAVWRVANRPQVFSTIFALSFLAAVLTFAAAWRLREQAPSAAPPSPTKTLRVAQMDGAWNCIWEKPPEAEGGLAANAQLELREGLVQIVFTKGAKVLLQGPARFRIDSSSRATLQRGRLTARVPPRGRGFTIDTDCGSVIDVGTEFGVVVDAQGDVEVHVFAGEVRYALSRTADSGEIERLPRLSQDQGIRLFRSGSRPQPLAAEGEAFVRALPNSRWIGSTAVPRPILDSHQALTLINSQPSHVSGRACELTFYCSVPDRWITPLIFTCDESREQYRITGIGQPVLTKDVGVQTAAFQLIAGSDRIEAERSTFGYFTGEVVAENGPVTVRAASPGGVPFDWGGDWHYTRQHSPTAIHLGRTYGFSAESDQPLWRERTYSARLTVQLDVPSASDTPKLETR